eukprot:gene8351-5850_t
MNYQHALERLASDQGLPLTPLRDLAQRCTPGRVLCCGGWVRRIYAESAVDSSIVLRDASGSVVCALHQEVVSRYPDVLAAGALLLLVDTAFICCSSTKMPPFLVAGLPNLAALMLPDENEGGTIPSGAVQTPAALGSADHNPEPFFTPGSLPPPYSQPHTPPGFTEGTRTAEECSSALASECDVDCLELQFPFARLTTEVGAVLVYLFSEFPAQYVIRVADTALTRIRGCCAAFTVLGAQRRTRAQMAVGRLKSAKKSSPEQAKAAGAPSRSPAVRSSSPAPAPELLAGDGLITLNIGGVPITTLKSTLLRTPSNLQTWVRNDFEAVPRDRRGRPFFDRDPTTFRHLLNFLRGYGLPEDTDAFPFLVEDAAYYGIAALTAQLAPGPWRFLPGPGVSPSGTQFSTTTILGICGEAPLSEHEEHFISFRFEKADLVEVGVVSGHSIRENEMLSLQDQAVGFRNTGELLKKLGEDVLYDHNSMSKGDSATVRVFFERASEGLEVRGSVVGPTGRRHLSRVSDEAETEAEAGAPVGLPTASNHHDEAFSSMTDATVTTPRPASDAVLSASITFESGERSSTVVWPAPVPPLYFAVSMCGVSAVLITGSSAPTRSVVHKLMLLCTCSHRDTTLGNSEMTIRKQYGCMFDVFTTFAVNVSKSSSLFLSLPLSLSLFPQKLSLCTATPLYFFRISVFLDFGFPFTGAYCAKDSILISTSNTFDACVQIGAYTISFRSLVRHTRPSTEAMYLEVDSIIEKLLEVRGSRPGRQHCCRAYGCTFLPHLHPVRPIKNTEYPPPEISCTFLCCGGFRPPKVFLCYYFFLSFCFDMGLQLVAGGSSHAVDVSFLFVDKYHVEEQRRGRLLKFVVKIKTLFAGAPSHPKKKMKKKKTRQSCQSSKREYQQENQQAILTPTAESSNFALYTKTVMREVKKKTYLYPTILFRSNKREGSTMHTTDKKIIIIIKQTNNSNSPPCRVVEFQQRATGGCTSSPYSRQCFALLLTIIVLFGIKFAISPLSFITVEAQIQILGWSGLSLPLPWTHSNVSTPTDVAITVTSLIRTSASRVVLERPSACSIDMMSSRSCMVVRAVTYRLPLEDSGKERITPLHFSEGALLPMDGCVVSRIGDRGPHGPARGERHYSLRRCLLPLLSLVNKEFLFLFALSLSLSPLNPVAAMANTTSGFFTDRLAGTREPVNDLEGLMDCARYNEEGDMELLEEYFTKHPVEINAQDGQGRTVVHMAAANGRMDVLQLLLKFHPKPNMQNEEGNSALHFAALNNRVDVATFLLQNGWKANLKNNFGKTPLQLICQEKGFDEMEALLLRHDDSLDDAKVECVVAPGEPSPSPPAREKKNPASPPQRAGPAPAPAPAAAPAATSEGLLGSDLMDGVAHAENISQRAHPYDRCLPFLSLPLHFFYGSLMGRSESNRYGALIRQRWQRSSSAITI